MPATCPTSFLPGSASSIRLGWIHRRHRYVSDAGVCSYSPTGSSPSFLCWPRAWSLPVGEAEAERTLVWSVARGLASGWEWLKIVCAPHLTQGQAWSYPQGPFGQAEPGQTVCRCDWACVTEAWSGLGTHSSSMLWLSKSWAGAGTWHPYREGVGAAGEGWSSGSRKGKAQGCQTGPADQHLKLCMGSVAWSILEHSGKREPNPLGPQTSDYCSAHRCSQWRCGRWVYTLADLWRPPADH